MRRNRSSQHRLKGEKTGIVGTYKDLQRIQKTNGNGIRERKPVETTENEGLQVSVQWSLRSQDGKSSIR